jgi:eukaryotic-like serine/threonine-protein kinase
LFDGETEAIVLVRAIEGRIDPPSTVNPLIDTATDAVVLRGLARSPTERYATARDMALAIEQTIGLASPYEVGEWVEAVAADELGRRARTIGEIESASLTASAPRIGLAPQPAEPPHSQVSSISVSRPAIPSLVPPKRSRAGRTFVAFAALLALAGMVFGGLAVRETMFGKGHSGTANELAHETRGIAILKPPSAGSKSGGPATDPKDPKDSKETATKPETPKPAIVGQTKPKPAPPPKPPSVSVACDPPFTIDPATGRKKYKLECLK